ncbi:TPA: ABC transporter permease, partial [Streptococcus pyogenes]
MVELKKFKRKKIFIFALLLAFVFPLIGTVLIVKGNSSDFSSINNFIREESGFLLLMPILVLLAINSFFLELDNNTMKNLLVIPISKKNIIISKLIVLLIFSIIFQIVGFGIGALMSLVFKIPLDGLGLNFILAIATGIVL